MKQLKYYKNDELTEVVYDGIDLSKKYHLLVKVNAVDTLIKDDVQLIDFNVSNYNSLSFYHNQ